MRGVAAELAGEGLSEFARASFRSDDPGPIDPGRAVADVLRVSALELGNPVAFLVLVVSDDFSVHFWLDAHQD